MGGKPINISDNLGGSVEVKKGSWFRRLISFMGPAYLVSVGYMDPGNWATDIEGGARFGYMLIWVLLMSNMMAVLLQTLSARLGIVTGYDLAQGCRREYPRRLNYTLWFLTEIAIAATDLAEVLGTIIGLNLLFGLPLLWGTVVTAFDTLLLLVIQRLGIRKMEAFILMLIGTIGASFFIEIFLAEPNWGSIANGFIPRLDPSALFIAIGIIGATVMPHNLYLHSSLVQTRNVSDTVTGKADACKFNLIDSVIALNLAFLVNSAILIMSAAVFYSRGIVVTEIQQAHQLLQPILGSKIAPIAFAVALIAAGQSSTLTGTLSGQIVMEGYLNIRMRPWLRRLLTRSLALIPAVIVIALYGSEGTYKLLILSQVILSLQLPFAIIPLIHFTSDRNKMGLFVNRNWVKVLAWIVAGIIVYLNIQLVWEELSTWISRAPFWLWILVIPFVLLLGGVLVYITIAPFWGIKKRWESAIVTDSKKVVQKIKPIKIKRIVVALEHSPADAQILSAAIPVARVHKASLSLVHVVETPGTMVFGKDAVSLHGREDEAYIHGLLLELEEMDIPVNAIIRNGKPAEELIKLANESDFDLLILGAHGHHGLEDIVYGETVTSVRHAINIPVLVVRVEESYSEVPQKSLNKPGSKKKD